MKKILLFIDNLGAGGAQRQLVGLAVMLKRKGYQVKVCYYQDIPFYAKVLNEGGVPHELIAGSDNHKRRIPVVTKYFKKENPDWVIAYQETPSLVACMAKILGGKYKLLVSERNTTQHIGRRELVRFFLYHWADAIVPNSYAQGEFLVNHCSWMKSKLQTINNFVDLKKFHPVEKQRREAPLILVAASIWPPKNVFGFIEAVRILKARNLNFKVEWYGLLDDKDEADLKYRNDCIKMLADFHLDDVMELLPKTHNIAEKYRVADFFCLPSFYEGTPNVICEAMASGCPIVCSNVCDNGRYVKEGINGFLFNPESVEQIADKIKEALSIPDAVYVEYGHNSRNRAETMLSEQAFIDKYLKIIQS